MLEFNQVVELIKKENEYGQGWAKGNRKVSSIEGVPDSDVHNLPPLEGQPFSVADYKTFAKKYWDDIDLAMSNFTPDGAAVRIRVLKVISLLFRCLMTHGRPSDMQRMAGVSSEEFPILHGGLKTFNAVSSMKGCLIPSDQTGKLRNESSYCNPLRRLSEDPAE